MYVLCLFITFEEWQRFAEFHPQTRTHKVAYMGWKFHPSLKQIVYATLPIYWACFSRPYLVVKWSEVHVHVLIMWIRYSLCSYRRRWMCFRLVWHCCILYYIRLSECKYWTRDLSISTLNKTAASHRQLITSNSGGDHFWSHFAHSVIRILDIETCEACRWQQLNNDSNHYHSDTYRLDNWWRFTFLG